MPAKTRTPLFPPPSIGTIVDDGRLELISILGEGGFSTVFLARSLPSKTTGKDPGLFAVKILQSPPEHREPHTSARQQQLHLREATLHSICSAHPSIAPLRKLFFHESYTCLVMDYYPEGDLFSAILTHSTYLSHPSLIKNVFTQILDGVEHCHSRGVYLRDLKPENVLVSEAGKRVHLTDFGLATSERQSGEFRTGSVYHMSPECMGPDPYSPQKNDIWSLGIILLNLVTSRNPWRNAHTSDPTFTAHLEYLASSSPQTPLLQRILPISAKLNDLLERILRIDPSTRISIPELKDEIEHNFGTGLGEWYSPDVVFEGGCARCGWEIEVEVDEEGVVVGPRECEEEEDDETVNVFEMDGDGDEGDRVSAPGTPRSTWSEDSLSYSYTSSKSSLAQKVQTIEAPSPESLPKHLSSLGPQRTPSNPKPKSRRLPRNPAAHRSTTPSTSTSTSSFPKTPRDIAHFGTLKVFDPASPSPSPNDGSVLEEAWQQSTKEKPPTSPTSPGFIQLHSPPVFARKLFGRAANLFSRA